MKINLEKICIGFFIGVLLFCIYNKIFLIEGVEARCEKGKGQKCPDGTPCDDIRNCENSDACICPSGGGSDSPPPTDGKRSLKPISNPSQFLSDVNKSFNDTSSNGVMVSMNVLNNKEIVNVDGSATILRIDSSWNIWFTPCFEKDSILHNSPRPCCSDDNDSSCLMSVGFGWIWDTNDLPHIDCVYDTDEATVTRVNDNGLFDRCGIPPHITDPDKSTMCNSDNTCIQSMLQSAKERLNCPNNECPADIECPDDNVCLRCDSGKLICGNKCIKTKVDGKRVSRCPDDSKCGSSCFSENEVVISRYTDRDGKNINSINIQNKPSALLFVYDPNIFGSKNTSTYNELRISKITEDVNNFQKIYTKLLNTLDEDTYVVIMESLKLQSEYGYGNARPKRIPPKFVDIIKLKELVNYLK